MFSKTGIKKDCLWLVLFLIVFINGFEAGGYQASLWSIGKNGYDTVISILDGTNKNELFRANGGHALYNPENLEISDISKI